MKNQTNFLLVEAVGKSGIAHYFAVLARNGDAAGAADAAEKTLLSWAKKAHRRLTQITVHGLVADCRSFAKEFDRADKRHSVIPLGTQRLWVQLA